MADIPYLYSKPTNPLTNSIIKSTPTRKAGTGLQRLDDHVSSRKNEKKLGNRAI